MGHGPWPRHHADVKGTAHKVHTGTTRKFEVRQPLLLKTFRELAAIADQVIRVKVYEGLDDISFHAELGADDFAVRFAGFGED